MSRRNFSKDPVLVRLEEFQEQQRGGSISEHLAGSYPALLPAAGFIGGLLAGYFFAISLYLPVLACCVCLCLWPFTQGLKDQRHRLIAVMALGAAAMFCLGIVRMEYWERPLANDLSGAIGQSPRPARLRGQAVSDIRKEDRESWVFGTFMPGGGDGGGSFYLDVRQVETVNGWASVSGCVLVGVSGRGPKVKAGEGVEICCVLSRFEAPANPWQFDVKKYMRLYGVCGAARVESTGGIETLGVAGGGWWAKAVSKIRQMAFDVLMADGPEIPDERTGLTEALLLGRRSNIRADTIEAFFRTGLAHFISLSGMNVGMLAGAVWQLGRMTGFGKRRRAALTLVVMVVFGMAVPPCAPTLRGIVLCVFFCFGVLLGRRTRPLNTLAVTAITLLLFRPADLLTAGWQLSYMTVLGIILFYEPLRKAIIWNGLGRWEWVCRRRGFAGAGAWILLWCAEVFCVGLAAWIGGAGILLWHFGMITAGTTLWTVLLLPVVTGIMFVGFAKMTIGVLLPSIGAALGVGLMWLSWLFLESVRKAARLDFLSVSIGQVPVWIVLSYYACLFLLKAGSRLRGWMKISSRAGIALLALAAVFGLGAVKLERVRPGRLEVWCLSVGHGQAIVARMPDGQTALFDAGSISVKDAGRRVVGPFLKSYGIRRIDAVAISHGDIDHFNALPEILQMFDAGGVYVNEELIERIEKTAAGRVLNESLKEAGVRVLGMKDWPGRFGDVRIKSIWPVDGHDTGLSSNDRSEVMMIDWAGRKILLCGDIEEYGQRKILELYPELRADVLVLPHHGSAKNLLPEFVRRIGAKTVLASCGRLRAAGAYRPGEGIRAYYTGIDGAVRVVIEPGCLRIE